MLKGLLPKAESVSERELPTCRAWKMTIVVSATERASSTPAAVQREVEHDQRPRRHHQRRDRGPLPEQSRDHALPPGARWPVDQVLLTRLEGEGDVLHAVGDEVEPEQLHRHERKRPIRPRG